MPEQTHAQSPALPRRLWLWTGLAAVALGLLVYLISLRPPAVVLVTLDDGGKPVAAADAGSEQLIVDKVQEELADDGADAWALWLSVLTLAVSIAGLVADAYLGWRQLAQQSRMDRLEAERLRVEVEKTLLEIRQLQTKMETPPT
ncbi:MAG: hypothetical protein H6642_03950 [Caldilineaceae bacterium]|nr:hypothetical protein [Caldilineaceae bacterium]MCB9137483.1 hypothetical protein [Caldilineaceae bacterium]